VDRYIKNAEESVGAYSIFITLLWYGKYSLATHGWIQHQSTGPSTIPNNALTFHFLVPLENIERPGRNHKKTRIKHEEMRHLLMRHAKAEIDPIKQLQ
jgi:hypothetical protein